MKTVVVVVTSSLDSLAGVFCVSIRGNRFTAAGSDQKDCGVINPEIAEMELSYCYHFTDRVASFSLNGTVGSRQS